MHGCWIDEGNDANYDKLRAWGIDQPYFSVRDPRVTASYLDGVVAKGLKPGLLAAWSWYPNLDGPGFADHLHQDMLRIGWAGNAPVLANIETHDVGYILGFFKRWRQLRPTRKTDWTLEGFQGGLFNAQAVQAITAANVGIAPQFYTGDMTPHSHSVILDLVAYGFPCDRIIGMYDAARLPGAWTGYAFTMGRLPA